MEKFETLTDFQEQVKKHKGNGKRKFYYICTKYGTHLIFEIMAVIQTTSRQFRDKQKDFFDLADKGEKVIIKRGKKQAYLLTPIEDDDLYFTPEMLDKIDKSIAQAKEGKVTTVKTGKELDQFLDNL